MEDIGIKLLFKTTLCLVFAKFVREFLATASIAKKLTKFRNDMIAELCVRLVHTERRASKNGYVCPRWYPNMQKYLYNRHVPLILPYISDVLVPSHFNNPMFVCPSATWDPINGLRNPQSGWRISAAYIRRISVTSGMGSVNFAKHIIIEIITVWFDISNINIYNKLLIFYNTKKY